jgi:hypothetical protein
LILDAFKNKTGKKYFNSNITSPGKKTVEYFLPVFYPGGGEAKKKK